ncbi:type 1 glycerol-3-phosphate oxidase [Atopobacter phocae]|uniref:type 1 glycerol-3-phosphate oxidase n=1 Tax=Atopobacter phocae TaxID=136492 RepID=UPI00047173DD|nr:type 1 glycerol-3-phosphate oxidase [Atopobacter phocae]
MKFSHLKRQEIIGALQSTPLDLLIVGGGITGAGIALQAAASGLDTGLIEMQDFAGGTSSRSTKLVHGGLRYLKQFDVEVVADTVSERAVVQQIAPHIPKPDPMLLPVYDEEGSTFNLFRLKVAMNLYDSLAHIDGTEASNHVLTREEVLKKEPYLMTEGLVGGGVYLDFNNNDARLVIENIKRAHQDGALIASRVKAEGYLFDENHKVIGLTARDLLTNQVFEIKARVIINATGPWSDRTRNLAYNEDQQIHQMRPTKGVHLVVDHDRLPVSEPVYVDTGKNDGRMIFIIPRFNKTYFGTTDTDYTGDFDHPKVTQEDVDYLLDIVNHRFPTAHLTMDDIESAWAGLRPLIAGNSASDYNGGNSGKMKNESFDAIVNAVKDYLENKADRTDVEEAIMKIEDSLSEKNLNPSEVSRGSNLEVDANGLITIAGGKITDYRKMAEGSMEVIIKILDQQFGRTFQLINSKTYPVSGGELNPSNVLTEVETFAQLGVSRGLSMEDARYLAHLYGSNVSKVYTPHPKQQAVDGLPLRVALSLRYAMDHEMALTPVDFFLRRTNHMLFMRREMDALIQPVINEMARYYEWTPEEKARYTEELEEVLAVNDLTYLKEK